MLLTDKYNDKIYGMNTCIDRDIIQGYIPGQSYAEDMTNYLKTKDIRIFDFSDFSNPLTKQVQQNAQSIVMKMDSKQNSIIKSAHSVKMTEYSISSAKPKKTKDWFIFFLHGTVHDI